MNTRKLTNYDKDCIALFDRMDDLTGSEVLAREIDLRRGASLSGDDGSAIDERIKMESEDA